MFDLKSYLDSKKQLVDKALEQKIIPGNESGRLGRAMAYSLMAGGKRIRPILCMASAEAISGADTDAEILECACALEMLHTYSLIHDDLPAMDNDRLRRGKQTCHIAFDESTAILAGDALLTLAFEILAMAGTTHTKHAHQWIKIIHVISRASGYMGMIEGQMRDILFEGKPISLDQLKEMHALKTGALIRASVNVGALLVDASLEKIDRLDTYARNIGLAFQITDDILNVEGDPEIMGKATGTDQQCDKATYPALLGLGPSNAYRAKLIESALLSLDTFGRQADPLRAIADYIIQRKK
jgi:geranylgeranyl diphosphate synthase type II